MLIKYVAYHTKRKRTFEVLEITEIQSQFHIKDLPEILREERCSSRNGISEEKKRVRIGKQKNERRNPSDTCESPGRKAKERKKESVGYMRIASGEQILFIDRSREKNVILLKSLNGRASQGIP
ncbi:hypothetical protein QE152_g1735 [Popillia japonica]|uniref:Uncharacterized protein n=1 Tax=Popillia japonica TaxID=7064 RepID=A0AAW1N5E1_POPJA